MAYDDAIDSQVRSFRDVIFENKYRNLIIYEGKLVNR